MQATEKKLTMNIVFTILCITILSIIFKKNLIVITEFLMITGIFIWYVYKDEKRLVYFSIWGILISNFLSNFVEVLSYIPYGIFFILTIKLFEKKFIYKQNLKSDKFINFMTLIIFLINILAIVYNGYKINLILFLFYSLKKFGYIILYNFFINASIDNEEIIKNIKFLFIYLILQFPIIIIQFFTGIEADNITGLFGNSATGIVLQYLVYMEIIVIVYGKKIFYFKNTDLILLIIGLGYSAIAEIKIGFIIIPIVFIFTLILERKFLKLIITLIIISISIVYIYSAFIKIYPEHDFINNKSFTSNYIKGAYGSQAINRSGFIPLLKQTVLDDKEKLFFGTGFGTVNPSSIEILRGDVAKEYDYMNIHFFTLPYLIVENGIIGTILWMMIYIYIIVLNLNFYIKSKDNKSIVVILTLTLTIMFMYYNSSIITSPTIILMVWFIISFFNDKKINIKFA